MRVFELDQNATTRPVPEVVAAVNDALVRAWHNPSSVHRGGQDARRVVELARAAVAELIGARPREITFTSGGTEALDLAIRGSLRVMGKPGARNTDGTPMPPVLVTTGVEHAAVRSLAEHLERTGTAEVRRVAVNREGVVEMGSLENMLDARVAAVCIQWANNETGGVQPVTEMAALCRARGVRFICDGTQWVGKMPVRVGADVNEGLGADELGRFAGDVLTFSPHKFHGPKGVGVVYARGGGSGGHGGGAIPATLLGTQEQGRRGGTENVPGIAGAGVAARLAVEWLAKPDEIARGGNTRDRFEALVLAGVQGARVNGPASSDPSGRLWNTTNIAFPRLEAEAILLALSEGGVHASAGAACSSGALDPSPVLLAMGVEPALAHGSVRFSISRETTMEEVEAAAAVVVERVKRVGRAMPGV